jgi:YfiR/HmsC-like
MLLAALVCLAAARFAAGQAGGSSEYQVKAAFLFHFAQFVDWPPETFKDAGSPLTYCTIGEDPFSGALDQSLSGKTIGTRPLRIQHLKPAQATQNCQVLFIGASETRKFSEIMASASGRPILTVGETEHFAADGGVIGFCVEANKIRFEVNLEAAEKANLKISARLLALAKTVIGNPKGN